MLVSRLFLDGPPYKVAWGSGETHNPQHVLFEVGLAPDAAVLVEQPPCGLVEVGGYVGYVDDAPGEVGGALLDRDLVALLLLALLVLGLVAGKVLCGRVIVAGSAIARRDEADHAQGTVQDVHG